MATKKPDPTPSNGPSHDFDKSVRDIVTKSHVPLTLKKIHAMHKASFGGSLSADSVEESVVSLVRSNKLSVSSASAKSMTLSLDAVSVLISDDPEVAIPQVLCLPPRQPLTNHEVFRKLTVDLSKNNMSLGAVDDALASLFDRGLIDRSDDAKYSCDCP
jgi:hypothetical protein